MKSRQAEFWRQFAASRLAMAGLVGLILIVLIAILAPWLSPQDPYNLAMMTIADGRLPPGGVGRNGNFYLLGTDEQGRDILSAIFYGLRTSMAVGLISVVLALALGLALGLTAGYWGGRIDAVIMRIVDLQLSIPTILIALMLLAILGKGTDKIIIALVAAQWAIFARLARGSALAEKEREYIIAAQCLKLGHARVILTQLLPNCMPPLIVVGTITIAGAISLEATLSFLGLGVPITRPSLGLLISNGFEYLLSGRYWISTYPGLALLLTIVCINLVGDHLREVLNPRLQGA